MRALYGYYQVLRLPALRVSRRHYAKRVTKKVLSLPQGLQSSLSPLESPSTSALRDEDSTGTEKNVSLTNEVLQYSTVLQGALDNIQKYPQSVLLTRVGGFYELYFNHAEELHQELGLKRSYKDTKLGPVAMAGFPFFQLDRYLKVLVEDMGRSVAISEEFARDAGPHGKGPVDLTNKNLFERRVSRVITPGTLIDEKFMETERSNYLLAIHPIGHKFSSGFGLAWMDLSTGDFITQEVESLALLSHLKRIQPKEIITSMETSLLPPDYISAIVPKVDHLSETWSRLVENSAETFSMAEALAGSMLLTYIRSNLPETELETVPPSRRHNLDVMALDGNALHSLEIRQSMRDQNIRGSLLHTVRRTVTKSGTRLLSDWLISPVTSPTVIDRRLDLVQLLIENETLRNEVTRFLKRSGDAVRVLQRFGFGRGEVDDLLTITSAITATEELLIILCQYEKTSNLTQRMEVLDVLRKKISSSIDEVGLLKRNRENAESAAAMMAEVLSALSPTNKVPERRRKAIERENTYTMRPSASPALRSLHKSLKLMYEEQEALQSRFREESNLASLTLKTLPGLSHIVHVKGTDAKADMTSLIPGIKNVSSTRSTKSYHAPEWSLLGTRIESTKLQIGAAEAQTFHTLRRAVLQHSVALRRNASVLDELDVANSFALCAMENAWVRPVLTTSNETVVKQARHPVVEKSLLLRGLPFTTNDVTFDSTQRIHLVTGTNMGGKSTYLRQVAILQVLAQVGSFVPAKSAVVGIKDAIFSRLGSSDDLYAGESTFMIEMKECAEILKRATDMSLVLMDEVGRGTTSIDGISLAFASLSALRDRSTSVLFATHFHELADLIDWQGVNRLCTDLIEEEEGGFYFSHKIRHGVCRDSHGLKVAAVAGIPAEVVQEANRVRSLLLQRRGNTEGHNNLHADVPLKHAMMG